MQWKPTDLPNLGKSLLIIKYVLFWWFALTISVINDIYVFEGQARTSMYMTYQTWFFLKIFMVLSHLTCADTISRDLL